MSYLLAIPLITLIIIFIVVGLYLLAEMIFVPKNNKGLDRRSNGSDKSA